MNTSARICGKNFLYFTFVPRLTEVTNGCIHVLIGDEYIFFTFEGQFFDKIKECYKRLLSLLVPSLLIQHFR